LLHARARRCSNGAATTAAVKGLTALPVCALYAGDSRGAATTAAVKGLTALPVCALYAGDSRGSSAAAPVLIHLA